jgi:hypothetical protein
MPSRHHGLSAPPSGDTLIPMSATCEQLLEVTGTLSARQQEAVLEFARFLQQREQAQAAGEDGDALWERALVRPGVGARLDAFFETARREAAPEPLDWSRR